MFEEPLLLHFKLLLLAFHKLVYRHLLTDNLFSLYVIFVDVVIIAEQHHSLRLVGRDDRSDMFRWYIGKELC